MKRDTLIALLITCSMAYATYSIVDAAYTHSQIVKIKKNFTRPCDVCPREY